ncbi:MAG TPA: restriction endonuclease subunit S [Burkholderiales bacterium]|nr:restriction endonuclease subunit S [Burkholderiales bacterium]
MAADWCEIRVGDLVDQGALRISDGYRVRNEELGSEGVPFVRGGDIGDGWINTNTVDHIRPEFVSRISAKLTQPGDAAFITKGTVGRAGWLRPEQPPVVFAPQVAYWRVTDRNVLDPGFVFYFMRSYEFQSALDGVKTHGAMAADYVSISQQHDFRFRFPDVETQRTIASILAALDDKIELNRRIDGTLEATARALFKSWFVDFDPVRAKSEGRVPVLAKTLADLFPARLIESDIGEIPEGWTVCALGGLIETTKGRSYTSEELVESSVALVTLKSFARGGGYRSEGLKPFVGRYKPEQVVGSGDLIIACTDVTQAAEVIGRPAIVRSTSRFRTLVASLDTLIVRASRDDIRRSFLYFLACSDRFVAHTYAHTTGTTVLHLAKNAVPSFRFACPPSLLIGAFDSVAGLVLDRIQTTEQESETLAELRDTLLPKLISGELSVEEAVEAIERV